jgi:hypothetical protein
MPDTWTPTTPVSRADAEAVRAALIEHFRAWTHTPDGTPLDEAGQPTLHAPHTGWGDHWVIVWVGYHHPTPYQWPTLATTGGQEEYSRTPIEPVPLPPGVTCEAIGPCELGIYPA